MLLGRLTFLLNHPQITEQVLPIITARSARSRAYAWATAGPHYSHLTLLPT